MKKTKKSNSPVNSKDAPSEYLASLQIGENQLLDILAAMVPEVRTAIYELSCRQANYNEAAAQLVRAKNNAEVSMRLVPPKGTWTVRG